MHPPKELGVSLAQTHMKAVQLSPGFQKAQMSTIRVGGPAWKGKLPGCTFPMQDKVARGTFSIVP